MILVGCETLWMNCVGASCIDRSMFNDQFDDVYAASKALIRISWSSSFQSQHFRSGEFHDTVSHKTWSVEYNGHTKKDYKRETEEAFRKRWTTKRMLYDFESHAYVEKRRLF